MQMVEIAVNVVVGDVQLSGALVGRISRAPGFRVVPKRPSMADLVRGDIVLTTPADCSLGQCTELSRRGVYVILLAAVMREAEREKYTLAGGRYIPMLMDTGELFEALLEASGRTSTVAASGGSEA